MVQTDKTYRRKTPMSTRTFLHVQIPIPIFWRLLKKPMWSTFWRRIALRWWGLAHVDINMYMRSVPLE